MSLARGRAHDCTRPGKEPLGNSDKRLGGQGPNSDKLSSNFSRNQEYLFLWYILTVQNNVCGDWKEGSVVKSRYCS